MKKPFRLSTGNPRSTSTAAIVPSTFRIRFSFFEDVTFSTSRAKSRCGVLIPRLFTYPTSSFTRLSGLRTLLTRCPMPGTGPTVFFMYARKSSTDILLSTACLNQRPASVTAPPKRSEEHTSELQSRLHLVCRLLLEKKKKKKSKCKLTGHMYLRDA